MRPRRPEAFPAGARTTDAALPWGYARNCGSASPHGFAPSPGSQQSGYGGSLGAGLGGYGAPGVTGLGVPGSTQHLNGSGHLCPSPVSVPCPRQGGRTRPRGVGMGLSSAPPSLCSGWEELPAHLSGERRPWPCPPCVRPLSLETHPATLRPGHFSHLYLFAGRSCAHRF